MTNSSPEEPQFPIRSEQHVRESESFRALEACLPASWMIRYVTERDYGVDCLLELVGPSGQLRGDVLALQLKSARIRWARLEGDDFGGGKSPPIRIATINYWLGLPLPVFLCVCDNDNGGVFFAPVNQQVRRRLSELQNSDNLRFDLNEKLDLATPLGLELFEVIYRRERSFEGFANGLLDLVSNRAAYTGFIEGSLGCDVFLAVDDDDLAQLLRLYRSCRTVSAFLGVQWRVSSLTEVLEADRAAFNDPSVLMHEMSRDKLVRELAPVFLDTIEAGLRLIHDREADFWRTREPLLFAYVDPTWVERELAEMRGNIDLLL